MHDYRTPVHSYFDLSIWPNKLPEALNQKAFIAYCSEDNEVINCGGKWAGSMIKTRVRSLGDYCIMVDDIPPEIRPINFESNMNGKTEMSF